MCSSFLYTFIIDIGRAKNDAINITTIDNLHPNINDYLEISKTLGTKNGILYLDYGNYFVPKE